jgi:hypothetical protein
MAHKKERRQEMTTWTANSAITEIEEIIQEGVGLFFLGDAQAWKGKLEVWLRRTCLDCPIEMGAKLKQILEDIKDLNLATYIFTEYGGSDVLKQEVRDQCIELAKVARDVISGSSEDSSANPPEQQGQRQVNATRELGAQMLAARNKVCQRQEQAADMCSVDPSTWARHERGDGQQPEQGIRGTFLTYISTAERAVQAIATGVLENDRMQIEAFFRQRMPPAQRPRPVRGRTRTPRPNTVGTQSHAR